MADDEASANNPGESAPPKGGSSDQGVPSEAASETVASNQGASPATPESAPAPTGAASPAAASPASPESSPKSLDPTKSAPSPYRPSYVFLFVVTVLNLVADLWSKYWAKSHFEAVKPGGSRRVVVIEDMMNFIFAKNRGGAWGLLQDETEALRRPFFLIVSVAAIVFIVSLYRKLQKGQTALKWGLPLVLGGALGNLVDRIRYGYVVDFIDIYGNLPDWVASLGMKPGLRHWPTFNVADISICVGVALMAIDMFTSRSSKKTERDAAKLTPGKAVEPSAPTATAGAASGAAAGDASERA